MGVEVISWCRNDTCAWNIFSFRINMIIPYRYVVLYIVGFMCTTIPRTTYKQGPVDLKLMCVDSYISLRAHSDIDCAIFASRNIPYDYAFTVRGGRCYVCHTLDTLRPHTQDEVSLQGPHYIAGETFMYSLTALFDYFLEEFQDINVFPQSTKLHFKA